MFDIYYGYITVNTSATSCAIILFAYILLHQATFFKEVVKFHYHNFFTCILYLRERF